MKSRRTPPQPESANHSDTCVGDHVVGSLQTPFRDELTHFRRFRCRSEQSPHEGLAFGSQRRARYKLLKYDDSSIVYRHKNATFGSNCYHELNYAAYVKIELTRRQPLSRHAPALLC